MTRDSAMQADRLAARRARAERWVRAVGHWTPELLGAALAAVCALWVWPGLWPLWLLVAALLLVRIPTRPLLTRWRAHRARTDATRPGTPLLTDHHTDSRDGGGTDWEASA